jgi:hypothetical protein
MYRPARAISVCISREAGTDVQTEQAYVSAGHVVTFEPDYSLPKVQVSIRAAGLAAESLVYGGLYEDLMNDPNVQFRIKTDTDNAKSDLEKAGLWSSTEDEFIRFFWRIGFYEALSMMRDSVDTLRSIAAYCLIHQGREIPKSEIVAACDL